MNIWFNHWFSTAYYFIETAKSLGNKVFATNERDSCIYKMNADIFEIEPVLDKEQYVQWALDFCRKNDIDVFFCKRNMKVISENINLFKEIGVHVFVEKYENILQFESKINTYNFFLGKDICDVPEMFVVNDADNFIKYYLYLKEKYGGVCSKLDVDEGGQSFKRIVTKEKSFDLVKNYQGFSIHEDDILNLVKQKETFDDMLLMPYLAGTEYSIDCLNTNRGLVAVPRFKFGGRITRIENNKELIEIANKFQKEAELTSGYNIQLRADENGNLFLLEVNTRLSGGTWKDRLVGVDFIKLALEVINKEDIDIDKYLSFANIDICKLENGLVIL